jgi:putative membrane protein
VLAFGFVMFLVLVQNGAAPVTLEKVRIVDIPLLIVLGAISAASMVIPGISGSFVLMLLGYYKEILATVGDLTNFSHLGHNLIILIPFGIGVLLGIFLITKLIRKLLDKYETKVYFGVLGFVVASVVGIVLSIEPFKVTVWSILIGVVTFIWGFLVTRALMKENKE